MRFLGRFVKLQKLFIFVKYNFRKAHEHMTLKIYIWIYFFKFTDKLVLRFLLN